MRIDLYTSGLAASAPEHGKETGKVAQRAPDALQLSDTVQFSTGSAQIRSLMQTLQQVPDIRQDRVQALRQLVQAGSYRLDPQRIADAMIANAAG